MLEKLLTVILATTLLLSVAMVIYVIVTPAQGEKFTEFYILDPEGMAYNYPTNLTIGENGTVSIGIVNHEYEPRNYKLKIQLGNRTFEKKEINLNHNETFRENFTFTPLEKGDEKMEFLLYTEGVKRVYRSLHLWVDVKG